MNRARMCGCPKYPRPQAISEMIPNSVVPWKTSLNPGCASATRAVAAPKPPSSTAATTGTRMIATNIFFFFFFFFFFFL